MRTNHRPENNMGIGYISSTVGTKRHKVFGFGFKVILIDYIVFDNILKFYPNDFLVSGEVTINPGLVIETDISNTIKINNSSHYIIRNPLYYKYNGKDLILSEDKDSLIYNKSLYHISYEIGIGELIVDKLRIKIKIKNI